MICFSAEIKSAEGEEKRKSPLGHKTWLIKGYTSFVQRRRSKLGTVSARAEQGARRAAAVADCFITTQSAMQDKAAVAECSSGHLSIPQSSASYFTFRSRSLFFRVHWPPRLRTGPGVVGGS